jgi:hypothetical protein
MQLSCLPQLLPLQLLLRLVVKLHINGMPIWVLLPMHVCCSLKEHLSDVRQQAMYAVVHGGMSLDLRFQSIDYLASLPFDGFAVGGALGKNRLGAFCVLPPCGQRLHACSPSRQWWKLCPVENHAAPTACNTLPASFQKPTACWGLCSAMPTLGLTHDMLTRSSLVPLLQGRTVLADGKHHAAPAREGGLPKASPRAGHCRLD